jgi:hypothetical protein
MTPDYAPPPTSLRSTLRTLDRRHLWLFALTSLLAGAWFLITTFQILTHPALDRPITTPFQQLWILAAPTLVGLLFLGTFLQLLLLACAFITRPATRAHATLSLLLIPAPLATLLAALHLYARVLQ